MESSSRTPEGSPLFCALCGKESNIDPSLPTGDATCPHCGHLAWLGPAANSGRSIRSLVAETATLAKSNIDAEQFFPEFTTRVVAAMAAFGGAVWTPGESPLLELKFQLNLEPTLLEDSDEGHRHQLLLRQVAADTEAHVIGPHSATSRDGRAGNPTSHLLVLAPVLLDGSCQAVVEVFQRAGSSSVVARGYRRFLINMCELFSAWIANKQ